MVAEAFFFHPPPPPFLKKSITKWKQTVGAHGKLFSRSPLFPVPHPLLSFPLLSIQTCWASALWHFQKQKAIKYKHGVLIFLLSFDSLRPHQELRVAARHPYGQAKLWWIIDRWQLHQSAVLYTFWHSFFHFFLNPLNFTERPQWRVTSFKLVLQIGTSMWTSGKKGKPWRPGANTLSPRA